MRSRRSGPALVVGLGVICSASLPALAATVPYGVAWQMNAVAFGGSMAVQNLNDVATAPDGTIVVAGSAWDNAAGLGKAFVAKVTKTGTAVWTVGIAGYQANAVTVAADGTIFIAGGGISTTGTTFVAAISSSGGVLWTHVDDSLGTGAFRGIGVAANGDVLATGSSGDSILYAFNPSSGLNTNEWDAAGAWSGRALMVDAAGNVWVALAQGPCMQNAIRRYDASNYGTTATATFTDTTGCAEIADLVVGPGGNVYGLGGVDVQSGSPEVRGPFFAIASPAGALVASYVPSVPSRLSSDGTPSGSGARMSAGTILPSGALVAAWRDEAYGTGVTAGTVGAGCGSLGCFASTWAANFPGSFIARRMVAVSGGWLFAAGGTGDGGTGSDDTRWVLTGMGDAGAKIPSAGTMEIRNNVIRVNSGDRAVIVVRGDPGASIEMALYAPSGSLVGNLDGIQLDASGIGSMVFDGTSNGDGGFKLGTGVYWILARNGVNDRKPVLIIGPSQGAKDEK